MSKFSLDKKTIIITGGAGLIGHAFVRACAEAGANLIVADIDSAKSQKLIEAVQKSTGNKNVLFKNCDVTNKKSVDELVKFTLKKFGRIEGLVNNAYPKNKNYGRKFEQVSYEDFCENVDMHLGGYFLMTQAVSKTMMKQGRGGIVFMGSIYGFAAPQFEVYAGTNMTMPVEYAAIKGGILNLNKYLASYLGPYGIRVNAISPGGIFNNQPNKFVKKYVEKVKLGNRMANVDDITETLVFLLSDASKYITGQNIVVDGGWSI